MPRPSAGRRLPKELRGEKNSERLRIRTSMLRWKKMDETASELGRGLGRRELLDRVAKETGASLRQVESALRTPRS